jgi:hypothetical protein
VIYAPNLTMGLSLPGLPHAYRDTEEGKNDRREQYASNL